ncbi:gamma-glutamyl-gamma-aminobutyrate hydrolase family protein [bacterium]|nr:gamma-glutamyl-gamma-aminobutyrate hydrolase family protein [bacterium]
MLKIGLSACFMYPDPNRVVFGHKSLTYLENDMARYVAQDGVFPVLIPDLPRERLMPILDQLDGIVFQGGADLCPESYGEPYLDQTRWPGDKKRDLYELALADYFFKKGLPILGICRGFQLLNCYFGGTLHQDIPSLLQTPVEHRNSQTYDRVHHEVTLQTDGWLSKLYSKKKLMVNSVHHQCVKSVGNGLRVEAHSSVDNIIEAFTLSDGSDRWVAGVQWHPEFSPTLNGIVDDPQPIIEDFLAAVRNKAGRSRKQI